ncbi:type I restriction enzyme, S subunit [Rubritalea squalenifaciens DSM 18772]|uniref:Type I restriction enzyme, S subunit n=1 Tax=Rubritalea squalenifaciens DSM 18772 TaxID=1123071 RepID=A0A1M6GUY6_9BACT|nr:restriction endonuclease subunit S [Rubritalea squalenifaciens]SHJ13771.1 type I restriction enzyme, S subunit [Rubritalea squalenifaciens DSM 18772]
MKVITLTEKLLTRHHNTLPAGWQSKKLGDVTSIKRGKFSHRPRNDPKFFGGETPFIQTGDIVSGNGKVTHHSQSLNDLGVSVSKVFPAGTIMMAIAANIGDCAILQYDCACTDSVVGITPRANHDANFFNYYLNDRKAVFRYIAPEGAQKNINVEFLDSLPIVTPPIPEQRKIAEILGTWDRAIETQDKLVKALTRRKQALAQQLLTGKTRLPEFEGKWQTIRINQALRRVFRPIDWSPTIELTLVSLRRRCGGVFLRPPLLGSEYKTKDLHEICAGDFLVSKRQVAHGALALVTPEHAGGHVSKEYAIFENQAPNLLHMPFFARLAQTPRLIHRARVASTGVHIEKLIFDPKVYLKEKIQIPKTVEEQQAIAKVLTAADQEITLQSQYLDQLRQQKRGLMQQLLTGKTRVTVS